MKSEDIFKDLNLKIKHLIQAYMKWRFDFKAKAFALISNILLQILIIKHW